MSLMMSSGTLVNFLSGPHSNRLEACPHMNCCGDFSYACRESSNFSWQGFGKRIIFVPSYSGSEEWETIGNVSSESRSQIYEETGRVWDPVQLRDGITKPFQRQCTGLISSRVCDSFPLKYNFSIYSHPRFYQR